MSYAVDFVNVSTVGLESSPVAAALAGLRANEARYFKNKYDHVFTVEPAAKAKKTIDWVHRILKEERDIVIASPPAGGDGLPGREHPMDLRVLRERPLDQRAVPLDDPKKRAVGFKLSDGMEVPDGARLVQVREAEVEAGRDDPRLVLRDQGRVLSPSSSIRSCSLVGSVVSVGRRSARGSCRASTRTSTRRRRRCRGRPAGRPSELDVR